MKIQLYDGTVETLSAVRHAPNLQRNLISVGMLDESGYSCKTEDGNMRITKGSYVSTNGVKRNGFDVLLGKTLIWTSIAATDEKIPTYLNPSDMGANIPPGGEV